MNHASHVKYNVHKFFSPQIILVFGRVLQVVILYGVHDSFVGYPFGAVYIFILLYLSIKL